MNDAKSDHYLTVSETAERLRPSVRHVYRLVVAKEITALRTGRKYIVPASAIASFVERKSFVCSQ